MRKRSRAFASKRPSSRTPQPLQVLSLCEGKDDHAWKLYSHFLKKQTHREVTNILRNEENGRDLSDVLEQLLEEWLIQHKKS